MRTGLKLRHIPAMTLAAATLAAVAAALLAGSAMAQAVKPNLAPGVKSAPDLVAPRADYVVVNGTLLYKQPWYDPGNVTSIFLKRGEHPKVIGEAQGGLWLLIGQNGQGVGYAPSSLLCPAKVCNDVKG